MIVPERIGVVIEQNNDLSLIKRDLRYATELAFSIGDEEIFNFGILSSQLNTLSDDLIGETEVKALISISQYEKALELAYSSRLIKTRIRLLANIYTAMEQNGVIVTRNSISELLQMVENFDTENLDPEEKLRLATDLYPILPDNATALVDAVKSKQSEANAMDLVFMLNMIQGNNNNEFSSDLDNIKDDKIRDVALIHSKWLTKLSVEELEQKISGITKTKSKEYILRQWCIQNKNNPLVAKVIHLTLDIVLSDPEYHIPLRHLRQLSDVVLHCPKEEISFLAKRFDIPNFISLESPIQEKVRLELNLVEALSEVSLAEASERFVKVDNFIAQKQLDNDITCYCYVKMWTTWKTINKSSDTTFENSLKRKIDDEFVNLINTSADQLSISKKILRALSSVDMQEGIIFAEMLNSVDRREHGLHELLVAYFRQERLSIDLSLANSLLGKINDGRLRDLTIVKIIDAVNVTGKIDDANTRNYLLDLTQEICDPIWYCQAAAKLIGKFGAENQLDHLKESLLDKWGMVDPIWVRVELAFDLVTMIATGDSSFAADLYDNAHALRDQSILADQTIAVMYLRLLNFAAKTSKYLDLHKEADIEIWNRLFQLISELPSYIHRVYLYSQLAGGRHYFGDMNNFNAVVYNNVLRDLNSATCSHRTDEIVKQISWVLFEYDYQEAKKYIDKLSYAKKQQAWTDIAFRLLSKTNIGDDIKINDLNFPIDLLVANKLLSVLGNIDVDFYIWSVVDNFARAISNKDSNLNEGQKLDILTKLDELIDKKLPDLKNITHDGYKVLCLGAIERAMRKSAEKSRAKIKKRQSQIISNAKNIPNIADRIFVLASLPDQFWELDRPASNQLLQIAQQEVALIPNVKDRISRYEAIATAYDQMHDTVQATSVISLARKLADQLDGVERDQILASLIQTTYQIDPELASEMTEKIDDITAGYSAETFVKSRHLAKSPNKLLAQSDEELAEDIIQRAAIELNTNLLSGKGVVSSRNVILNWLSKTRLYTFDTSIEIAEWAALSLLQQTPTSMQGQLSAKLVQYLILNCLFITEIGRRVSFLSKIPENIKTGFKGLSTDHIHFGLGERDKAIRWVSDWLLTNSNEYIKLCDPYFDPSQLWILKIIPTDIEIKIITTGSKLGLKKEELDDFRRPGASRAKLKKDQQQLFQLFENSWKEISNQEPPPTLILVHSSIYGSEQQDAFHDRFIITKGAGLTIGTSLNHMGNKEFFITSLTSQDAAHIEEVYIDPKLNLQEFFSKVIHFELGID